MSPECHHGPMSPGEVLEALPRIPAEVFDVFNELITQNLRDGTAKVLQKDVMQRLENQGMNRQMIYANRWLDIEDDYRRQGWDVFYEKPVAYAGETFDAYFEFSASRQRMVLGIGQTAAQTEKPARQVRTRGDN